MIVDFGHYSRVFKNILYLVLLGIVVYSILKLFIFFSPFLIALIIANCLEPAIRKLMTKLKLKRKTSTTILLIGIFTIIVLLVGLLITTIVSEASKLLENINIYMPMISDSINSIIDSIDINRLNTSIEIKNLIQNSSNDILVTISGYISNILKAILNLITKLPEIGIYIIITFLGTYFICADRYYIKDQFEYHIPKVWAKKFNNHFKEISIQLINYVKAEIILVIIAFIIVLVGLYILKFIGLNIGFPLMAAIGVGIVDALPILGSGTVLIPWAIISSLTGDLNLGIGIICIYIVVLITRQLLEPKIVSNQIGIHPIFTLISMYAGFKIIGILGLIVGPIILIIYKNVFESLLERGLVKTIFERE